MKSTPNTIGWRSNALRALDRLRKSSKEALREYFLANVGKVLNSRELQNAAGGVVEWARRIRELRNEDGFQIHSHNDDPRLKPGEYILRDPVPQPSFSRSISAELRALVLDRNGFTCQSCGIGAGDPHPDDNNRRARLHVSHISDKSMGGGEELSNLRTMCSLCNQGAKNITPAPPSRLQLMAVLRRANREDQVEALEWLKTRYENS